MLLWWPVCPPGSLWETKSIIPKQQKEPPVQRIVVVGCVGADGKCADGKSEIA